jgi:PAS domain S-box-containing protein
MIILIKCGLFLTLALLLTIPLMASAVDLPAKAVAGQRLKTIIINNYHPYTFMNDKGEPDGFSVDIARAVTRAMDIELEIRADKWDVAMKALEAGSIDLLPMMAQSPERDILFDFSVPHTIAYDAIFIKKGTTGIQSLKDLSGKTVIVMNRDIAHSYLLSSGLSETMKITLVDSLPEALKQLAAGKGDAAIMPKLVGIITAKKLTLSEIETLPQLIVSYTRPFSFAVKNGNQALLERLNQGLNIIKSSGEYDTIYKKWFGALEDPHLNLKTAIKIGATAVVILLGFVVWNVMLKREVKAKTEHLLIEIADHKRAEEEKEELAQRFKLAVSSARLGVWDWNVRLNTMEWDDRMFELYGIMQKTSSNSIEIWMNGLHPEDKETAIAECQAALKGEKEFDTVFRVLHPDGTVMYLKASALVIQGADGMAERMIGINSDITERKQYEQELQQKNAELERFTYTVSHDLKSPIITIKGFTGSLEKDLENGNYQRMAGDLKRVSAAADKMNDLLRDLLELSTIGRIIKTPEVVDMNLLVADVLMQLAGPLKNRNLTVAVQPGLPEILCDKRRMAEVVQNLIENAINCMGEQAEPRIQFGMRKESGENTFFVQDNGIGIEEKYHQIIFGLFNKLDAESEGTGIGLALVKRIIEVHAGRVWVESEGEGMGSRFCFTVPG